jgi:peptide-methionine (S)-S-oxide reductase
MGDHTETFQVDYDPAVISYDDLLDMFWREHNPTYLSRKRQYMSLILFHNEAQRQAAVASREREAQRRGGTIYTEIAPLTRFYLAEDYHQKFYLQQEPELTADLHRIYPRFDDWVASTAVARLNGYAGSYGTPELLQAEIDDYGLSADAKKALAEIVRRFTR